MTPTKRTEEGKPYLSWCLIARNCEDTIEACLQSIRKRTPQAEIVVVDTMSNDQTAEIAKRYADVWVEYKGPKDSWTREMEWFDDAASARQKSFDLASGRWRGWIDTDDTLTDPAETENILKLNNRWKPSAQQGKVENGHEEPQALEDMLRVLDDKYPEATMVWAPYAYRLDDNNLAVTWQDRERICKWDEEEPLYHWKEQAHEILVPKNPSYKPPRIYFAHLLFRHHRKFDEAALTYSVKRHFDVLQKLYDQGEQTTRRSLYLTEYAHWLAPTREKEFLESSYNLSTTILDKYRSLVAKANYFNRLGFYFDAVEHFGAAITLYPILPDAFFFGANVAIQRDDNSRAIEWLEKGLETEAGQAASYVNPREHVVLYPTLLGLEYEKLAKHSIKFGKFDEAATHYNKAVLTLHKVATFAGIGDDGLEAQARCTRIRNEFEGHLSIVKLSEVWDYLIRNDESQKAVSLLKAIPWTVQNHPLVVSLIHQSRPVETHLTDYDAYVQFYNESPEAKYFPTPKAWMQAGEAHPIPEIGSRINDIKAWLKAHPDAKDVLDVGSLDGNIAIPVLHSYPQLTWNAVEINKLCWSEFEKNAEEAGITSKIYISDRYPKTFVDLAVWCEVIEHVQDPAKSLRDLGGFLKSGGEIFLTTPHGAYDQGYPPAKTYLGDARGIRGHVRAMTLRDVATEVEKAGLTIRDGRRVDSEKCGYGDSWNVFAKRQHWSASPVSFIVPGALWDWNGRSLKANGMGASESMIVYVAEELAKKRKVEVFGPVPEEDTLESVSYWHKEQMHHLYNAPEGTKLVVSRSPASWERIDEHVGKVLPKILWLQDVSYTDLNTDVAKRYEKIVCVSNWHKQITSELHKIPLEKIEVAYNGIVPSQYRPRPSEKPARKRDHFIYASSPDRGLIKLLQLWPQVLSLYPEATLSIFYGWKGCEKLGSGVDDEWLKRFTSVRKQYEAVKFQKGLREFGMINADDIAREFMRSGVWLYPTDFAETCCTNAIQARAAGAVPVTTNYAGLSETALCEQSVLVPLGVDDYDDRIIEGVRQAVETPDIERDRMSEEAIETYAIEKLMPVWERILS